MTINTTILIEIWKARNMFKHERKKIPMDNIMENIKRNLKEIITIHFSKHQKENTITTFQEKFTIQQNALCTIQRNSLTFHFKTKVWSHIIINHIHTIYGILQYSTDYFFLFLIVNTLFMNM